MYARKNLLKEKVARGEVVFGTEVYLRDPRVVEIMGAAGFDFMHIENEHVAHNWETVEDLVRAAELWGMTPMFRCEQTVDGQPPVNQILKALKCGCLNVMVPHVGTAETAQKIVDIVKFPPLGKRGIATMDCAPVQMFPYQGSPPVDIPAFKEELNRETMIWVIIETPEGVENVDAILEVEGIDAVGFGYQDYANAAGLPTDSCPQVKQAQTKVRQAGEDHGKLMWWKLGRDRAGDDRAGYSDVPAGFGRGAAGQRVPVLAAEHSPPERIMALSKRGCCKTKVEQQPLFLWKTT